MSQAITEEMGTQQEWYAEAAKQTPETIADFIKKLTTEYKHDYGTICHAVAAAAIGGAWAVEHSPTGGITRFQAGAIMWEFIRNWNYSSNKTGLKIIDYDNFLYPQYAGRYDKVLSQSTWDAIKREAKKNIEEADASMIAYKEKLTQYKKDIADFIEKYPDYPTNKEKYNRLGMGTGAQWEEYHKKEASGFEFAPSEPYEGVTKKSPVYKHWQSIVSDIIPFGYRIEKEN